MRSRVWPVSKVVHVTEVPPGTFIIYGENRCGLTWRHQSNDADESHRSTHVIDLVDFTRCPVETFNPEFVAPLDGKAVILPDVASLMQPSNDHGMLGSLIIEQERIFLVVARVGMKDAREKIELTDGGRRAYFGEAEPPGVLFQRWRILIRDDTGLEVIREFTAPGASWKYGHPL